MTGRRIPRAFYRRPTLEVARDLIGQRLVRLEGGRRLSGWIIETEAYIGQDDLGCHARAGRTARNHSMWGPPGHAYVYFTYGMHWCLNVVTEANGKPAAVLIRGLLPSEGVSHMRRRRPAGRALADGPAKLCQALGIHQAWDGHDLCRKDSRLFIERAPDLPAHRVRSGPRVGLDRVPEPWKSKPWRFRVAGDPRTLLPQEEPV